jgi:hypothetical protein
MTLANTLVTDRTLLDTRLAVGASPIIIWRKRGLRGFCACVKYSKHSPAFDVFRVCFPRDLRVYTLFGLFLLSLHSST